MFNKGASEKEKLAFAEYPHGKWSDSGHSSEYSPNDSPSDLRTATNKKGDNSVHSSSGSPNQNATAHFYPQTTSNGHHYDRYHISQGELSNKVEKSDVSYQHTYDRQQKTSSNSSQVSNELHERLKQRVSSGSQVSSECDSNESCQNSTAAESSTVMKVALGEIGSISKYVSQGSVSMPDVLTPTLGESSGVVATSSEGDVESNIEMQPELTITNAFSLSAEMWDTGQDQKPEEEPVDLESRNPMQHTREEFSTCDENQDVKGPTTDSEAFDLSKVKQEIEEGPFSCSHCGMVTSDSASLQEHMNTHKVKKTKVYLHQCSVTGCDFSTNVIREFISHYSNNHDGLPSYVCRWCKCVMNSLSVFVDHVRENFVVPWVKCPHCHLKKKNKSEVVEHISVEHPGESQRVIAGSMFLCRSSSHSREKDSKIFSESHKTLVSLLNNQKYILNNSNHNGNDNVVGVLDPGQSGQGYQCNECTFNTTNAQVFLAHIKVCESMKSATKQRNVNFECKECSFATSSREAFLNHSHVKASLMNGMKRAPYKKRPIEVRNELIRKKILSIKKQTLALKLKKDKEAMDLEASQSGENEGRGHFKFNCPYCSEKFHKLNRMKFHIFLSHRDSYSQTFPLHQCLSCHMKSSSEEIVRQHIERTHFGRKSGILLINEPPEIIPRKYKTPDPNKKLVQSIAPIIKVVPASSGDSPKKTIERCSSWGRNQTNDDSKHVTVTEVISQETNAEITDVGKLVVSAVDKETPHVSPKPSALPPEQTVKSESEANLKKKVTASSPQAPPPKNLAMEIVKFTAGDHFTEYIQCPRCSYQSRSVMGFYGHIKRHLDLVVHINTRRKYEFHKPKVLRTGLKTEEGVEETASAEEMSTPKTDEETSKENPGEPEARESLSPMSPADPEIKSPETPLSNPPKLESIIINKKSENLIDKDEYSKLGGPILNAKLSSLYTSNGQVKVCNICDYMADFACYIHRHLLSSHLNIHFWECAYCFYRHLQRHKVIRHCARNHTNREPYAKWLGIPDWEKKLADCLKKTKSDESNLPDRNTLPTENTAPATESSASTKSQPSPCTTTPEEAPKVEKSEPTEMVKIEKLPGNLFKCGSCTMCSIHIEQVVRHIRYQHNAEGQLPSSELETGKSRSPAATARKLLTPSQPLQMSARPPASTPSTIAATSSPMLKKSPTDRADTKSGASKTKCKKKITPITVPKTPYRCVFCNYVNMSATEVKKHMWREHSDELNNVGILLKSKEESEKVAQGSSKGGNDGSSTQKGPPVKRKLKRAYRPHKRKKTKTYSKGVKEPSKKKSLAKPNDTGLADTSPKWGKKKSLNKNIPSGVSVEDPTRKRPASGVNNESPVMPKKRQIQSTQHSDYEWESPSLAEPPNSKSERIYKSVEKTEEGSYRMSSYFEKSYQEKEAAFKSKSDNPSDVPLSQENYSPRQKEDPRVSDNLAIPAFRKAEMDIYKRFIFKTYDGMYLCNYCLISMTTEIEARLHILQVHPKKMTNPLEQPCKTFQIFRKKTRRPEIIVPHAAQPRTTNQTLQNQCVRKKGMTKKKTLSMAKFEESVAGIKKESRASLFDLFENLGDRNQGNSFQQSVSGRLDEKAEQALLKGEDDVDCVFTWRWDDTDDENKAPHQYCTDSQQISVLRLITYRQSINVTGHFKCPFCQLTSSSHIRVSDHIRLDHMELKRFKCQECSFRSWFQSLLENHKRLQHVTSLPASNEFPLLPKDYTPSIKVETSTEPVVQAPLLQEPRTNMDDKKGWAFTGINVITDYRTLYLRTYCQKSQAVMYLCTICCQILPKQNLFFEHVTSHYGEVYQCSICSFKACQRENMEKHIQIHRQFPNASLIILHHEPLLNVENHSQSEQMHEPVMDPPLISAPDPNEKPIATLLGPKSKQNLSPQILASSKLAKHLTFCCSNCSAKLKGLKAFSMHLDRHNKLTAKTAFLTSESAPSAILSSFSPADDDDDDDDLDTLYIHQRIPGPKKPTNFAVRVILPDMFSFYSDNIFSFYS